MLRFKMNKNIKNLDIRELIPFERHSKIFENWNVLKSGEILRIINDHEPKPLYYLFQAEYKGQFKWEYEKQGPKDWIFRIIKISKDDKREKIKGMLKKLHKEKVSDKVKEEAKSMLKDISPTELALIEQEIIEEGATRKEMRKLCDVHLEIMKDNFKNKDLKLKSGHPIHTLMEEHKEILNFVDKLKMAVKKLESAKDFKDVKMEIKMLRFAAKHLVEADKHHQREEEVLFPGMEKSGITEPPEIMREEHKDIKPKKKELYNLAENCEKLSYQDFVKKVKEISEFLIKTLPDHIYKEDNILYPMAIEVIKEKERWKKIKKECDKIGYCCFTPEC